MLAKTTCLHIPPLYEEGTARIMWESSDGADGYELDVHYDEDFETASTGKTWSDIENAGISAAEIEALDLTWEQIAKLPAQGLNWRNIEFRSPAWSAIDTSNMSWQDIQKLPVEFTAFKGIGEKTQGPDQGLAWANINSSGLSWSGIEELRWNWEDFMFRPSVGINWSQIQSDNLSWAEIEARSQTWHDFERQAARGLGWGSLDGRFLGWGDIESKNLTWKLFENLPPDDKIHIAHTVDIPIYKKKAIFRVRSYKDGGYSDYLTSSLINTLPRSLAKYKPPCLHIPELHEGETAGITWGGLYGAQAYVLERKLGGGKFVTLYDGPGQPVAEPGNKQGCPALSAVPDVGSHLFFTNHIPLCEKTAEYRVRAYNTTDSSRYAESGPLMIIPAFTRQGTLDIQVTAGGKYGLLIAAQDVQSFKDIPITLRYPSAHLTPDTLSSGDSYRMPDLRILKESVGELVFSCGRRMENGQAWSGPLLLLTFTARTGGTVIFELA